MSAYLLQTIPRESSGTNHSGLDAMTDTDSIPDKVYVLNQKRSQALREIDGANFLWLFHTKVVLIAGVGFFADAYDLFAITQASIMLAQAYPQQNQAASTDTSAFSSMGKDLSLKVIAQIGTFFGALIFGWLADTRGRKRMYGIELILIIIGTLGQAISNDGENVSIIGALIFWRFIMGLGIGGDYPSSAILASEFAPVRIRGRLMTAVIASQGWGQFSAAVVAIVTISRITNDTAKAADLMWRILIGAGCIPGLLALFSRFTIPETPRFTMDIERDIDKAKSDIDNFLQTATFVIDPDADVKRVCAPKASWDDFREYFGKFDNLRVLIGCSLSWFALDLAFYGLALNAPFTTKAIFRHDPTDTPHQRLWNAARANIIVTAASLIPGFYLCFLFIDFWGRKRIQAMGFAAATVLLIILGAICRDPLDGNRLTAMIILYCILYLFFNFGPNTTTFIIPAEFFPTRYRSTAHGIATASGKLGAIVAQIVYGLTVEKETKDEVDATNLRIMFFVCAAFSLIGVVATYALIHREPRGKSLEDLSNEDQDNFITAPHTMRHAAYNGFR